MRIKTVARVARASWRSVRRMLAALRKSPPLLRVFVSAALMVLLLAGGNWIYHAVHKPSEVLFPLDDTLNKTPTATWREYGSLFKKHSTAVITPELLAALAQVEGAGNPVARTYWRWQYSLNPFEVYRPASSAVGMYQITDGTFQLAKRYCVHDHVVVEDGPWNNMKSCWFNSLYSRVVPSHAIELTAALLDRHVAEAIGPARIGAATLRQKQDLAALIHLCGAGAGHAYARRGFRLLPHQRCGDHDARAYLTHINAMKQQFARLDAGGRLDRLVSSH
jgi:hypothetical protein